MENNELFKTRIDLSALNSLGIISDSKIDVSVQKNNMDAKDLDVKDSSQPSAAIA